MIIKKVNLLPIDFILSKKLFSILFESLVVPAYVCNIVQRLSLMQSFSGNGYLYSLQFADAENRNEVEFCIHRKIEQEINNEKIVLEAKNNLVVKIEEPKVKKQMPKAVQPIVRGKPIPYASGITREYIEKHRHLGGPCDPNEIIEKKEKKSNSFFCAKFTGYY